MKINMSLCQVPFNLLSLIDKLFFVLKVKQSRGIILTRYKLIFWLNHTRAFKNILNVVGTYTVF